MPTATIRRPPRRHPSSAVGMVAGAKGKGKEKDKEKEKGGLRAEGEEGQGLDRISDLPDAVLGDIVSLLPIKDGARTQVLSSRWRPVWLSAPLNLDLFAHPIPLGVVPRILSSHPGPGRRFSTPVPPYYEEEELRNLPAETLDDWLLSPALNGLQELLFGCEIQWNRGNPPPLPTSALRFSRTLRVATFCACRFPDGINVRLPLLQELSLSEVIVSESSLQALLAGCPALQSLMLTYNDGYACVRIASPTLRSIDITTSASGSRHLLRQQLVIEDAPCLERLNQKGYRHDQLMEILVISAPKLGILGHLYDDFPRLQIGTTVFKGLNLVTMTAAVRSVKVLTLSNANISLFVVLNIMICFPCLENLNIHKNVWGPKCRNLINTHEIHLKKLLLTNYGGSESHVDFVKFFVLKARVLESIRLELAFSQVTSGWTEGQRTLLQFEKRASRGAQLDFVCLSYYV